MTGYGSSQEKGIQGTEPHTIELRSFLDTGLIGESIFVVLPPFSEDIIDIAAKLFSKEILVDVTRSTVSRDHPLPIATLNMMSCGDIAYRRPP
jgi:hypothetical protein